MNKKNIFRIAKKKDIRPIMSFIKKNWDKNHILGNNYNFFCYEYLEKRQVNFLLALNSLNKKIEAIQGFIAYDKSNKHICGSITCVGNKVKKPYLGIQTMIKMLNHIKPKTYCGIGTNEKTMVPLVKKILNRHVGTMDHYYILNTNYKGYNIANISKSFKNKTLYNSKNQLKLFKIKNFQKLNEEFNFDVKYKNLPFKSKKYIKKRYFEHPIYQYICYGLFNYEKLCKSFLITREVKLKNRKILRIIDYRGNIKYLGDIKESLLKLINDNKYEYIDLLCSGIPHKIINSSGFKFKSNKDKNIIPTYFDPFIKKNINIWYEKSDKKLVLFKGDADSDRPRRKN